MVIQIQHYIRDIIYKISVFKQSNTIKIPILDKKISYHNRYQKINIKKKTGILQHKTIYKQMSQQKVPIIQTILDILKQQPQPQQQKYFCYFYIRALAPSIYGFVELAIGLLLLYLSIRQYRQTITLTNISRPLRFIYLALFSQCIVFLLRIGFVEALYWIYRGQMRVPEESRRMSELSRYTFAVDIFGIFCIQAMMILVCYNWMIKIIQILNRLSQLQNLPQQTKTHTKQFLKFEHICSKAIKFYMLLRCFLYGLCIGYMLLIRGNPEGIEFEIILGYMIGEAVIVPVLLAVGIYAIRRNQRIAEIVGWDEIQIMINQYIVLILCTFVRFCFGLIQVIKGLNDKLTPDSCFIETNPDTKFQLKIVITYIFQDLLSYFVPVYMVLRIFRVWRKDTEISASLLESEKKYLQSSGEGSTKSKRSVEGKVGRNEGEGASITSLKTIL